MFKNILVPTDGSPLSRTAAKRAVELAKATGASITGFHVAPSYKFEVYTDYVPPDFMLPAEYSSKAKEMALRHLEPVRKLAEAAGVPFESQYAMSDYPADAIVKAVKKYDCDGVVMATHSRNGMARLLLGSETQKVLVSTKVPVVVTH